MRCVSRWGDVVWCRRGELIDITFWRHAGLMIDQKMLLPVSEADWESAARCKHDRRWGSEELAQAASAASRRR
ncbi:MAG: hypothetical protein ACXV3F_14075 [Frankiaceae bacterium]